MTILMMKTTVGHLSSIGMSQRVSIAMFRVITSIKIALLNVGIRENVTGTETEVIGGVEAMRRKRMDIDTM
jgi:hypothetical protein